MMRLIAYLLFFLSCSLFFDASATIPGPDEIKQCPCIKQPLKFRTLLSGNTFGTRYWTDGKMEAPFLPEFPIIWKSKQENVIFWEDQCKVIGKVDFSNKDENSVARGKLEYAIPLEEEDYYKVLNSVLANNSEREKYLRIHAWWASNDKYRLSDSSLTRGKIEKNPRETENMETLLKVALNEQHSEYERLLKAEVARQLGKFEEAKKLIDFQFRSENIPIATIIKKLIDNNDLIVKEIKLSDYEMISQHENTPISETEVIKKQPSDTDKYSDHILLGEWQQFVLIDRKWKMLGIFLLDHKNDGYSMAPVQQIIDMTVINSRGIYDVAFYSDEWHFKSDWGQGRIGEFRLKKIALGVYTGWSYYNDEKMDQNIWLHIK